MSGGKVIGVETTPGTVAKAAVFALQGGYGNVEFRLARIESLPVADESAGVIIGKRVVNNSQAVRGVADGPVRGLLPAIIAYK